MEKRQQAAWHAPSSNVPPESLPKINLFNSLTGKKELFVPQDPKNIKWYTCGPTVYDSSHMGHARTYISFDILRRVMRDYFGFNITYVMNITDIDDKIIKRARQNHLMIEFKDSKPNMSEVVTYLREAEKVIKIKSLSDPEPEKRDYFAKELDKLTIFLANKDLMSCDPQETIISKWDALADVLDGKKGKDVNDKKIFESLPKKFEAEFHHDMDKLNIEKPDVIIRVSESLELIVKFIEGIIKNGFAYVAKSGSVYFDTLAFAKNPDHFYAKLVPTAYGDANQLAVGEGELSGVPTEKRCPNDFALWKSSKPGEPFWDSPWSNGRPGWHIECSAMATSILGDTMDIHSGGVDLKFPHHDNELAQSEAYHGHSHWVNYFLHSGHLTISGCKMSKSLKNFITIRQALESYNYRQLRMSFLLHSWKDTLDYSEDSMAEAISFEKVLFDFLFNVTHVVHLASLSSSTAASNGSYDASNVEPYIAIVDSLDKKIYDALCDSVDTKSALNALREVINEVNAIQIKMPITSESPNLNQLASTLKLASMKLLRLMRIFGVAEVTRLSKGGQVGWDGSGESLDTGEKDVNTTWINMLQCTPQLMHVVRVGCLSSAEEFLTDVMAYLNADIKPFIEEFKSSLNSLELPNLEDLSLKGGDTASEIELESSAWPKINALLHSVADFRQKIRHYAQKSDFTADGTKKGLLTACDRLRDQLLPPHGIRLQDRALAGGSAADVPAIGLVPAELLLLEQQELKRKREQKVKEKAEKELAKLDAGKLNPKEMFLSDTASYSKFDENGLPTHDNEGKELAKSRQKKLKKMYDAQAKKHADYLEKVANMKK